MANKYPESNPLHHTTTVRGRLGDLVNHLHQDVNKVSAPSARAFRDIGGSTQWPGQGV